MALRVTHRSLFANNLMNLQQNLSRIQQTQNQLSSGKLISMPSDEPAGTATALTHREDIRRAEQLIRNADDGIAWLTTADSAMQDVNGIMMRARELAVAGANGTLNATDREAIAVEIDSLRAGLVQLANTSYLDRPIFGGTTTSPDAYDAAGNFLGNTDPVTRTVRPGFTVDVAVNGPAVFGPAGSSAFDVLTDLSDHLRTDPAAVSGDITQIDARLTDIREAWATVGARYAQVETMRTKTENDLLLSKEMLSEVEDIDLPATIVELQLQETAYQAALSATARAVQPSLLDFLR